MFYNELNHDIMELVYELEQGGVLFCGQELDGILEMVCELERVCGLEQHDNHPSQEQVDIERHDLYRIRRQHIRCNDPLCILHFEVCHQKKILYNDHKQHFRLSSRRLQNWYLYIHLLLHMHTRKVSIILTIKFVLNLPKF